MFAPQKSIVRKLYEAHARPFVRVVRGLPMSWDASTAVITRPSDIEVAAWSPCDRFIAITWDGATTIDVLDSVTLQRLQTLKFPPEYKEFTHPETLVFSPDSHILTCCARDYQELAALSWDLQTGGIVCAIRQLGPTEGVHSVSYFPNGKMVGVRHWDTSGGITILILDVTSGACIRSRSPSVTTRYPRGIWTHGESLRFTTILMKAIIIWEVGFTSDAGPTRVATLPIPEYAQTLDEDTILLSTPCRLALAMEDKVVVWDFQNSKLLLHHTDTSLYQILSFSSDGHFFACSTTGSEIYLWKESPSGYILHQTLASSTERPRPLLSTNGESIVAFNGPAMQSWRTKGFTSPPSSVLTRSPQHARDFVVDFSPDGTMAAVAREGGTMVTVLYSKSGVPQLTIDTGMGVCGLRVIGDTIAILGHWKVITWDLPTGDYVPDAKVTLEDSTRTIDLIDLPRESWIHAASISPDSCHIAFTVHSSTMSPSLYIHNGSTGERFVYGVSVGSRPWFTPDGCNLWITDYKLERRVFRVCGGQQVAEELEHGVDIKYPPEGYPWVSPCGYRVTSDWWILGPDGKRLLILPPLWQCHEATLQVWKGRFLALLHYELPELVILELD